VARSIDTDGRHLQSVLKRMAAHKGIAFLEILQNCPVFNDGIYEELKDRKIKSDHLVELVHREPLVYGAEQDRVLKLDTDAMRLYPGRRDAQDGGVEVTHDECAPEPTLATLLGSLGGDGVPTPIGVFRADEQPSYADLRRARPRKPPRPPLLRRPLGGPGGRLLGRPPRVGELCSPITRKDGWESAQDGVLGQAPRSPGSGRRPCSGGRRPRGPQGIARGGR
jgi:hypothetical protein